MRIPLPQLLSIGTDIVHLPRLLKSPRELKALADRILHPAEQKVFRENLDAWNQQGPEKGRVHRVHEWLGGRLAAKEAAKKAWGADLVGFKDVRIKLTAQKRPYILCSPFSDQGQAPFHAQQAAQLSIAHDGDYATATVLASPLHDEILVELGRRKAEAEKKVMPPLLIHATDGAPPHSDSDITQEPAISK